MSLKRKIFTLTFLIAAIPISIISVIIVRMGIVKKLSNDTLSLALGRVDNLLYRVKKNQRNRVEYENKKNL